MGVWAWLLLLSHCGPGRRSVVLLPHCGPGRCSVVLLSHCGPGRCSVVSPLVFLQVCSASHSFTGARRGCSQSRPSWEEAPAMALSQQCFLRFWCFSGHLTFCMKQYILSAIGFHTLSLKALQKGSTKPISPLLLANCSCDTTYSEGLVWWPYSNIILPHSYHRSPY